METTPIEKIRRDYETVLSTSRTNEPILVPFLLEYDPSRWLDFVQLKATYYEWLREETPPPPEEKTRQGYRRSLQREGRTVSYTRSDLGYDDSISINDGVQVVSHDGQTTHIRPVTSREKHKILVDRISFRFCVTLGQTFLRAEVFEDCVVFTKNVALSTPPSPL